MLCRPGFSIGEIRRVAFEVAMFVALWDARAFHDFFGALLCAALAGDGHIADPVFSSDQFKTGSPAVRAIFPRHRFSPEVLRRVHDTLYLMLCPLGRRGNHTASEICGEKKKFRESGAYRNRLRCAVTSRHADQLARWRPWMAFPHAATPCATILPARRARTRPSAVPSRSFFRACLK